MAKVSKEFAERFLGPKGKIMGGALGGAISGGFLYSIYVVLILGPQAFVRALSTSVDGVITTVDSGYQRYLGVVTGEVSAAWDPFQLGPFSLPANMIVAIAALGVVALGVNYFVGE